MAAATSTKMSKELRCVENDENKLSGMLSTESGSLNLTGSMVTSYLSTIFHSRLFSHLPNFNENDDFENLVFKGISVKGIKEGSKSKELRDLSKTFKEIKKAIKLKAVKEITLVFYTTKADQNPRKSLESEEDSVPIGLERYTIGLTYGPENSDEDNDSLNVSLSSSFSFLPSQHQIQNLAQNYCDMMTFLIENLKTIKGQPLDPNIGYNFEIRKYSRRMPQTLPKFKKGTFKFINTLSEISSVQSEICSNHWVQFGMKIKHPKLMTSSNESPSLKRSRDHDDENCGETSPINKSKKVRNENDISQESIITILEDGETILDYSTMS